MFPLLVLALVACAGAAPRYHHHHHPPPFDPQPLHNAYNFDDFLKDDMFDTSRFWDEFRREMLNLEAAMADLSKRFQTSASVAVDGEEYKVTIPLEGYTEKEIVVKANTNVLMVQAVHSSGGNNLNNYLFMYTLPEGVEPKGSWTFTDGVLKIVFPLKKGTANPEPSTIAPEHSREEMDNNNDNRSQDVDVGLNRGDQVDREVETNEIPKSQSEVEMTTYAVDLKDEVEFVPMPYKKHY